MNPKKKRATSKDVANQAGVSRATVSAYINKSKYVSPELIEKIKDAIEYLNYTPNEIARSLKLVDNKTIGLIIPVLSGFYIPLMQSINDIAQEMGYSLLLSSSEENVELEKKILRLFSSKQVSGVLIVPISDANREYIELINNTGIPVVQINRRISDMQIDSVVSDNKKAIYTATKYLFDHNRDKVALLGYDPNRFFVDDEKLQGYLSCVSEYQLENFVVAIKEHDLESTADSFGNFLMEHPDINGVVCTTRTCTEAAVQVMVKMNIKVSKNMSLVGYDDNVWARLYNPPITMISEDRYQMGKQAMKILMDRISGKKTGKSKNLVIEMNFIERTI